MKKSILCPTRGGQASYPNQERAIQIARERGENIIFLYVSNLKFLDHRAAPLIIDIETELEEMGEFLLAMAIEKATNAGVEAEGIVEKGEFSQVLVDVIQTHEISTVIIGVSRMEPGVLAEDYIELLAKIINMATGVEVIMVHNGEIIQTINDETSDSTLNREVS